MATQAIDGSQAIPDREPEPLHQQIAGFLKNLVSKPLVGLSDNELEDIFDVRPPLAMALPFLVESGIGMQVRCYEPKYCANS